MPVLFPIAAIRSFEATPLETVSETTANASIGDLNGDGWPDIVAARSDAPSLLFFSHR